MGSVLGQDSQGSEEKKVWTGISRKLVDSGKSTIIEGDTKYDQCCNDSEPASHKIWLGRRNAGKQKNEAVALPVENLGEMGITLGNGNSHDWAERRA